MKSLIVSSWKKLSVGKRRTITVLALTLLIHALLLVLFRQAPPKQISVKRELPRVKAVDLTDPWNKDLTAWMNMHDPSVTTLPDRRYGFSRTLNDFNAHPALEDMPTLPPLSLPSMPVRAKLERKRAIRQDNFPAASQWHDQPVKPDLLVSVKVWINGSRNKALENILTKSVQDQNAALPTLLVLAPARLQGLVRNIELKSSCGNKNLDAAALSALSDYLKSNPVRSGQYDRITILWPEKARTKPAQGAEI